MGAAMLPFNSGRTLPSKWEDAEKWIFSPVVGDGVSRPSVPLPQRCPKSKSGPLGPPGVADYSMYSPSMPMFENGSGSVGNFMMGSSFSAGALVADGLPVGANIFVMVAVEDSLILYVQSPVLCIQLVYMVVRRIV